mgnify:CR=1 FL=1
MSLCLPHQARLCYLPSHESDPSGRSQRAGARAARKAISYQSQPSADSNSFESLYYRHVGKIYTPYIICNDMNFDTTNLRGLFQSTALQCPSVDAAGFEVLFNYAKQRNFDLTIKSPRY